MTVDPNCLSPGETVASVARRDGLIGFDVRFARNTSADPDETEITTCDPHEAELATVYGITREGLSQAIHDVDLDGAGADELAQVCRALFVAILDAGSITESVHA